MELDLAARALCQSLDLASGGRERVLDRDLDVPVAPVIGRLVADHDVLVGRNRYPDVDTIDGTVAVLRARRDDGNTTPGNAMLVFLQPLHLMSNCCEDGLLRFRIFEIVLQQEFHYIPFLSYLDFFLCISTV